MYEVYTAPQSGHFIDTVSVLGLGGLGGWFAGGAGARRTRLGLIVRLSQGLSALFLVFSVLMVCISFLPNPVAPLLTRG